MVVPGLWIVALCAEIAMIPCFIVFVQMIHSNDHPKMRNRLHKTYLYFGIIFGLISFVVSNIYTYYYFENGIS